MPARTTQPRIRNVSHWRTFLDSDVIRFVDLGEREHVVQIAGVKKGKVTGSGGKSTGKAMITFRGREKPLGAGTAILSTIASLYGTDTKAWVGKWLRLYPDPTVKYGGQAVGGVRVRPSVPNDDDIKQGEADIAARAEAAKEAAKQAQAVARG